MAHIPYGYIIKNGNAEIDPIKGGNVQKLFELYVNGAALDKIAVKLGILLTHVSLGKMIKNSAYTGEGFYPALITRELFDKAQAENTYRLQKLGRNREAESGAFHNLIYCEECGGIFRRYREKKREFWRCSKCGNYCKLKEEDFNQAVMNVINWASDNINFVSEKPHERKEKIQKLYDDPIKQAEYAYSLAKTDGFDYYTKKLLNLLSQSQMEFDSDFIRQIFMKITVPHTGCAAFVFINGKHIRKTNYKKSREK